MADRSPRIGHSIFHSQAKLRNDTNPSHHNWELFAHLLRHTNLSAALLPNRYNFHSACHVVELRSFHVAAISPRSSTKLTITTDGQNSHRRI